MAPKGNGIRRLLRILWVLMVAAVVAGSMLPAWSAPVRALAYVHINDKLQHFGAYYTLAALPALHESRRALGVIVGVLLGLAIGLEFVQLCSGGRSFEVADMVAGACGVGAGLLLRFAVTPSQA